MSEMIDLVARAIAKAEYPHLAKAIDLGLVPREKKEQFEACARAAIEAMREPTEAAISVGYDTLNLEGDNLSAAYRAMIGAALK
jgi:hypothetical protein